MSNSGKAFALALTTLLLYVPWLGSVPVHIVHDEVMFALNAHAIATSGIGLSGERFPIYFHVVGNFWSTPLVVYYPALFQLVAPPTAFVIRFPTVILGAIDVALTYLVAKRLFGRERPALIAAALLALTPAHLIHSRLGVDHIYPVPFVLGAFWFALDFEQTRRERDLACAGALLGLGVYSYVGSFATMPLYLLLILAVFARSSDRPIRAALFAVAGFGVPLLPLIPWLITHPQQLGQQMNMYNLAGSAPATSPLRGLLRQFNYLNTVEHVRVFYEYFNPAFLFFNGDSGVINSTREAGVFLLPAAVFMLVGANYLVNRGRDRVRMFVLAGFLIAPLAAVMVGEVKINRALTLLPMGALLAAYGVEEIWTWRRKLAMTLLALAAVQFVYFYGDYLFRYPRRTGIWFEGNRYGAFDAIRSEIESGRARSIYLAASTPWIAEHWRLYLAAHRQPRLFDRTTVFNLESGPVPADAVAMIDAKTAEAAIDKLRGEHEVATIRELDGSPAFVVLKPRSRY